MNCCANTGENIGTGIGAIGGLSLAFSGVKEGEVSLVPTKPWANEFSASCVYTSCKSRLALILTGNSGGRSGLCDSVRCSYCLPVHRSPPSSMDASVCLCISCNRYDLGFFLHHWDAEPPLMPMFLSLCLDMNDLLIMLGSNRRVSGRILDCFCGQLWGSVCDFSR